MRVGALRTTLELGGIMMARCERRDVYRIG
jgi:hypothetical protein